MFDDEGNKLKEITWCEDKIHDDDIEYLLEEEINKKWLARLYASDCHTISEFIDVELKDLEPMDFTEDGDVICRGK